jgi:hypothetical protein
MYNVFEKYDDVDLRNAQIVYMKNVLGMKATEIQKYVDLAASTINSYARKFADMIELAIKWFGDKVKEVITKVKEKVLLNDLITFECDHRQGECAYIIEYFDSQKKFLFLKVGKTDHIERRVKQHLREYAKHDATYAVIKELHFAEDNEDALTIENLLRKHYKAIPNCGFIKNDRFEYVRYNKENLDNDITMNDRIKMFEVPCFA